MSRQKKKRGKQLFFIFLLLAVGFGSWFAWGLGPASPGGQRGPGEAEGERDVEIKTGMGVGEIAAQLYEKRFIRSPRAFAWYAYLTGNRVRLEAGEFTIPKGADVAEIIAILTEGAGVKERTVRIIEGWTIEEMDAYLTKEGLFSQGAFKKAAEEVRKNCQLSVRTCQVLADFPEKVTSLEGYLFPDTYRLYADAIPEDLIDKMLTRFGEKTNDEKFKKMFHDSRFMFHDVVTMASIIEAEVPHAQDRPLVSGLLWKRIDAGMPLQVDATINYVTGKKDRAASLEDVKINSPYNTYLYPDLPPGPIGNPGMEALLAAVSPKDSPYWFYLSTKDGTTIFSKTFEEHKTAKAKYLR